MCIYASPGWTSSYEGLSEHVDLSEGDRAFPRSACQASKTERFGRLKHATVVFPGRSCD